MLFVYILFVRRSFKAPPWQRQRLRGRRLAPARDNSVFHPTAATTRDSNVCRGCPETRSAGWTSGPHTIEPFASPSKGRHRGACPSPPWFRCLMNQC
ncbi:hypothetical protein E2C01_032611 [Portunus trituberculatus]|uniref:Uncharacterized protein n=1 Tax=Portunus trituberculatus TaxID=210409 RepID=A0A5B7EWF2_PORTR|nr:hypothetical protein [Portunus trituberculatus]